MKCKVYLFFLLVLLSAVSYAQDELPEYSKEAVTYRFIGGKLYDVLAGVGEEFDLTFDYTEDLPNEYVYGKSFKEEALSSMLDKLLEDYDVHYVMDDKRQVVIRGKQEKIYRQYQPTRSNFTVSGVLVDAESGERLPFATVYVKSTMKGTTSNIDGNFTLLNTPSDTSTIVIQYIGYKSREVRLNPGMLNEDRLVIQLSPASTLLEEIVISGQKEHMIKASGKVSSFSISPSQLSALPGLGEKDIFRSLQMLPGISGTNETSSGLYVRGGTPDQNLILFDGFTVYHVDHFYGFFSAFNANSVKDIQLYKGGFEAKYGGRLSSVVLLTGKDGNTNEVAGNVGASALSVNGSLEVPLFSGKGSMFLSVRRSFTDVIRSGLYNDIFDLFEEEDNDVAVNNANAPQGFGGFAQTENEPAFYFYDLNSKFTYRPSDKDVISVSLYNGVDKLDNSDDLDSDDFAGFGGGNFGGGGFGGVGRGFESTTTDLSDWGNVGTSLKWSRQWSDRFFSNSILSYSEYFSNREIYTETEIDMEDSVRIERDGTIEDNKVKDLTFRMDNEYQLTDAHTLEFGLQVTSNDIDYLLIEDDTTTILDRDDQGITSALYLQDTWIPSDRLSATFGMRLSHFNVNNGVYLEPRLAMSYKITDRLKAKAAFGTFNQFVTRVVREDVSQGSRDFWLLANDELNPVSSAIHYIAGISYETNGFLFDVETYYKDMTGLSEYTLRFSNQNRTRSTEVNELFYEGTGYAQGIEFLAQKKFGKYTGWIGYTLSETIHEFQGLSDDPYPALHDQTHEFKIVNSLRLGRWSLASTWVYATGKPYTRPIGWYEVTLLDGNTASYVSVGEKNAFRLPDYHRMDLSATYSWPWGTAARGEVGMSVFNLYNNTNIWYKTFEVIDDVLVETDVTTIGFTPNIFFNIKF